MNRQQETERAVVIGGSMAGLLAARVLVDYYPEVVILERDPLPDTPGYRKGTPQGRHAHALLAQGRQQLEAFFPGLIDSLVAQGAPLGHGRLFSGGGYFARHPQQPPNLFVSRPLLEAEVRRQVRRQSNVHVIDACDVLGLTLSDDRRRVTGVRLILRQAGSASQVMTAALVVDASGRGSRLPDWLDTLGYTRPDVEVVDVGMGYVSRLYERKPDHLDGDLFINVAPTPQNTRAGAALAQEGDRWIVTLAGYFGHRPPIDPEGFLAFARTLPNSDMHELLCRAKPLTDPVAYGFPANQRRRYERLHTFPAGLLAIGDSICSFTPIYGQGMSTAAMEARVLHDCLVKGRGDLGQRFFRAASKVIDTPWSLTVGNDRRLAGTKLPAPQRVLDRYMVRLQAVARHDPEVALAFQRVGNLLAAPPSLLHPRIALRVFRGSLLRGRMPAASQPSAAHRLEPS